MMRIQILGTAAAEGWPAIFCGCRTCERARATGGKNIRTRQSVQIDGIFKIDLPPDTHYHQFHLNLRLSELKHLFFTHSHDDHFAVRELHYLRPPFAHDLSNSPVRIYGSPDVISKIDDLDFRQSLPIETITLKPFEPIQADYLTFTPIPGHHKSDELCLTYVAQSDTATALLAWDTGLYDEESMERLCEFRFDLIVIECTQGTQDIPSHNHMGLDGVLATRDRLISSGAVHSGTRIVATHFSHNTGLLYDELVEVMSPHGIGVAWDGMVLEC